MRQDYQTSISVIAQLLQHGSSLLVLPLILITFSSEALGIWYILISLQSFVYLLDMGLSPSFSRAVSQAFSGAEGIQKKGLSELRSESPNYCLLYNVIKIMKIVYLAIGVCAFVIFFVGGTLYFGSVKIFEYSQVQINLICLITALAMLFQLGSQWINSALIGAGHAYLSQISVVISRCVFLCFGLLSIMFDQGILGLVTANLIGIISSVTFKLAVYLRKFKKPPNLVGIAFRGSLFRDIWYNSWRLGAVGLATFIVLRYGILLLGYFESVSEAGKLGLLVQISSALIAASMIPWQVGLKSLVSLKMSQDLFKLRRLTFSLWSRSLVLYIFGMCLILILEIFNLFDNTVLSGVVFTNLFLCYFFFSFLELNHTAATFFIAAGNNVPFLNAATASAAASLVFASTLVIIGWGLIGVILAQGIVQLAWNNWFWPRKVLLELKTYG